MTHTRESCPDDDLIARHVEGRAAAHESERLRAHLEGCEPCRRFVSELIKAAAPAGSPHVDGFTDIPLERGAKVGRYVLLELIGVGSMGVVYAAQDPQLDRRIALKLLRDTAPAADRPALTSRLFREAQSMARLRHPNVVAIHDVGISDGQVFLAMDLVEGRNLRAWVASAPRGQAEILRIFIEAGRGLAAAHRAGLVHRDFKPDNVLVGDDGSARVSDFGLASTGGVTGAATLPPLQATTLTESGSILGTPAYMAPEQFRGNVDARSDLFAFCVTLWEALYGERPFPADSARASFPPRPPAGVRVPARIRRALLRGLSPRPDDRPAHLDALLLSLETRPWRWLLPITAAAATLAVVAVVLAGTRGRGEVCAAGATKLGAVWNPARTAAAAAAFTATGAPDAAGAWARTEAQLARYAQSWRDAYADACEATRVRGDQSEALLDRRMDCLDERLRALGALLTTFAAADAVTIERATMAAYNLRPLTPCADRTRLLAVQPPPEGAAAALVEQGREAVARASAEGEAGHYDIGLELAVDAVAVARRVDYPKLLSEALAAEGRAREQLHEADAPMRTFQEAIDVALRGGDDVAASDAMLRLLRVLALPGHTAEATALAPLVGAQVARAGGDPQQWVEFLLSVSWNHIYVGRGLDALAPCLFALAILEREHGADDPRVASGVSCVGSALRAMGRSADAIPFQRRALELFVTAGDHRRTPGAAHNLAGALESLGRFEEARAVAADAVAARVAVWGPDHLQSGQAYWRLASPLLALGRFEEALVYFDRSLSTHHFWQELGNTKHHPDTGTTLGGRAQALAGLGRIDDALATIDRAISDLRDDGKSYDILLMELIRAHILEEGGRDDEAEAARRATHAALVAAKGQPFELGEAMDDLARADERRGRWAEALRGHLEASALLRQAVMTETVYEAPARIGTVRCLLALGEIDRARVEAEQVVALVDANPLDPQIAAEARFVLARALAGNAAGHPRALAVARQALAEMRALTPRRAAQRTAVQGWLARCDQAWTPALGRACTQNLPSKR